MVFVCVSDNDSYYLVFNLTKVAKVGYKDINTMHLIVWKTHPDINNDSLSLRLKDGDIAPYLPKPSKRSYADLCFCCEVELIVRVESLFLDLMVFINKLFKRSIRGCVVAAASLAVF